MFGGAGLWVHVWGCRSGVAGLGCRSERVGRSLQVKGARLDVQLWVCKAWIVEACSSGEQIGMWSSGCAARGR